MSPSGRWCGCDRSYDPASQRTNCSPFSTRPTSPTAAAGSMVGCCAAVPAQPLVSGVVRRRLEPGDPLAFDTDMVGPFWYCADISRTWVTPGGPPSPQLLDRYDRAREEIEHNVALLEPGLSFHEWSQKAFRQADEFIDNRYACLAHGVGMTDEYPKIYYRQDWDAPRLRRVDRAQHGHVHVESFVGSDPRRPWCQARTDVARHRDAAASCCPTDPLDRDNIGGVAVTSAGDSGSAPGHH